MRVSADEARAAVAEMVVSCPELAALGAHNIFGAVLAVTVQAFAEMERSIDQAGIGQEIAGLFLGMGAHAELCEQFPEGDDRRRLCAAGRVIGRLVAKKWEERIAEELARGERGN